ncbi:MAG TPA: ABC transporter substrate-binding protein, partial [Ruminococcaceae bacterium]|nr:ABC transporter substrate-binding protein [Oscillospiraceae bacterium]
MKKLKAIMAAILATAAVIPFTACAPKNSDTITMSTNAEFEPFEYKEKDKIVGIDVDIANKIA